jgi:hypothetical protein
MSKRNDPNTLSALDRPPTWLELESVRPMPEVERITSLSSDTLKRRHGDKVKKLSLRREGMKLKDALAIANGK